MMLNSNTMKSLILSIFVLVIFSCNSKESSQRFIKNDEFITVPGIFYFKSIKIEVKEFNDGSLLYGIADKKSNIIYQQNINETFSNYSKWMLYVDDKDNIWFYTGDLQLTSVLLKGNNSKTDYVYKKIIDNSIKIPEAMKKKIDN